MHIVGMLVVTALIVFLTSYSDPFDKAYDAGRQGMVDEAIHHYTQALESGDLSRRNLGRALNNRAIAYYQKGLYDRALADLDKAIQVSPEDLDIARNRETTYRAANPTRGMTQAALDTADTGFAGGLRVQQRIKLLGLL